jgi:hypothetical protein
MTEELTQKAEILFRQIHPQFMVSGEPTSQAFGPTIKDEGKLSVDRSELTDAKGAYELYNNRGKSSVAAF